VTIYWRIAQCNIGAKILHRFGGYILHHETATKPFITDFVVDGITSHTFLTFYLPRSPTHLDEVPAHAVRSFHELLSPFKN
jgi:hypothetical protein